MKFNILIIDDEKNIREGLRAQYGMAAYAVKLEDEIRSLAENGNVVLDGLYSWSEYKYLSEKIGGIILLAVVTDSGDRYERIAVRPVRPFDRNQSMARDIAEIENLEKKLQANLDYSLEHFKKDVKDIININ